MEAKPYPKEKRSILIQRNLDAFVTFLKEIEAPEGKQFIRQELLQRQVPGFRKDRVPLTLISQGLINDLKKEKELTNTNSIMWGKFKTAWTAWVASHHQLNSILLDFDNQRDFDDNHNCISPPNSELDIQCFKILLEASLNNQIDQETIRRFYEFGYFLPSDEIEDLIEKALPRAEIEQKRRIAALPDLVAKLSEAIDSLNSRLSNIESTEERAQEFDRQITEVIDTLAPQLSETEANFTKGVEQLKQAINSRVSKLEDSVMSIESQVSNVEFLNNTAQEVGRRIQERVQSHGDRLDGLDRKIAEIRTEREEQRRITNAPRIAHQAVQIGEDYSRQLREENQRYSDEKDYLSNFGHCLRRFGITDSDEMAAAIHVALKTFPALAINDTRVFKVWQLMCGNHCHITEIGVEMGWLGLQDWFPEFFLKSVLENN